MKITLAIMLVFSAVGCSTMHRLLYTNPSSGIYYAPVGSDEWQQERRSRDESERVARKTEWDSNPELRKGWNVSANSGETEVIIVETEQAPETPSTIKCGVYWNELSCK